MPQILVKILAILGLTHLNLIYFLANPSVIFTWLIIGLRSLMVAFIREILSNMCIVILCKPGCDIINFKINIIFLIKPFGICVRIQEML